MTTTLRIPDRLREAMDVFFGDSPHTINSYILDIIETDLIGRGYLGDGEVHHIPGPAHKIGIDGVLLDVNDEWLQMFGYKHQDVVGRSLGAFFDENSKKLLAENIKLGKTAKTRIMSCRMRRVDGEWLDIILSGRMRFDKTGQHIYGLTNISFAPTDDINTNFQLNPDGTVAYDLPPVTIE